MKEGHRGPSRRSRRWPGLVLFFVGVALIAVFGLRSYNGMQFSRKLEQGEIQLEMLRGWMTLPYIAKTHGVSEGILRDAIGIAATGHDERSLHQWLKAAGIEATAGRAAIEAAILTQRQASEPGRPGSSER